MRGNFNPYDNDQNSDFNKGDHDDWDDDEMSNVFFGDEMDLVSPELIDGMVRSMGDRWREAEENKAISIDTTLMAALNKIPAKWLDAACTVHHMDSKGRRKQKVQALSNRLTDQEKLTRAVRETPAYARAALRRILESGGWMRLNSLLKDFGDMAGDGWFWDEQPPSSCLGELRTRALLFVGKAIVSKVGKKAFKVVVVPKDIRATLLEILADPVVIAEEQEAIVGQLVTPSQLFQEALQAARNHYADVDWHPVVSYSDVQSFLTRVFDDRYDPLVVWQSLEVVLAFIDQYQHEIREPSQMMSYHVSELVHEFIDRQYLPRWNLSNKRDLLETVRRFFDHLHHIKRIDKEALMEVQQACEQISKGRRKLNHIKRPPPLGGELILSRLNPNTGEEERYTYNHQRLIMVWAMEFHQDWRHMINVCKAVTDGEEKAALVDDLIALEPNVCELLIVRADEEDFANAINWFYEESVIALSAW